MMQRRGTNDAGRRLLLLLFLHIPHLFLFNFMFIKEYTPLYDWIIFHKSNLIGSANDIFARRVEKARSR